MLFLLHCSFQLSLRLLELLLESVAFFCHYRQLASENLDASLQVLDALLPHAIVREELLVLHAQAVDLTFIATFSGLVLLLHLGLAGAFNSAHIRNHLLLLVELFLLVLEFLLEGDLLRHNLLMLFVDARV